MDTVYYNAKRLGITMSKKIVRTLKFTPGVECDIIGSTDIPLTAHRQRLSAYETLFESIPNGKALIISCSDSTMKKIMNALRGRVASATRYDDKTVRMIWKL